MFNNHRPEIMVSIFFLLAEPRFECHTSGKIGPPRGAHPWPVLVFLGGKMVGSTTEVMKYDTNPKQYKFFEGKCLKLTTDLHCLMPPTSTLYHEK